MGEQYGIPGFILQRQPMTKHLQMSIALKTLQQKKKESTYQNKQANKKRLINWSSQMRIKQILRKFSIIIHDILKAKLLLKICQKTGSTE